ncbi:MAG: hypothetical protein SV487_11845, partial [Thermodesulfobacteriota bacterium]|nr:hypothetical protein [Thermodesulfobacteriota bacterium]
IFFFAPKIIGGRTAPTLAGGPGVERMDWALDVDIVKIRRLGPDILLEAVPLTGGPLASEDERV